VPQHTVIHSFVLNHRLLTSDTTHPSKNGARRTTEQIRMLLRLRTPDGTHRLTLEKDSTFNELGQQVRGPLLSATSRSKLTID